MKLLNINERRGNYKETDSNRNGIPGALKENEPTRVGFRRNNPISLARKEDDFMVLKTHFFSLCNIKEVVVEGAHGALRSPWNTGRGALSAACPPRGLGSQAPAREAHSGGNRGRIAGGLTGASSQ